MHEHVHDHEAADESAAGHTRRPELGDVQRALAGGTPEALGSSGLLDLQRAAGNASVSQFVQREEDESHPVHEVIGSGGGRPLEPEVRGRMEQALGQDFGDVRIHTDQRAAQSAASVQAKAYTAGSNVVFGDGQYSPGTTDGDRTLAHELTHVVQQRSGPVDGTPVAGGIKVSDPSDRFERAADAAADAVVSGGAAPVQRQEVGEELEEEPVQTLALQRQEEGEELEEEPVQTLALQREGEDALEDEEEPVQTLALQRQEEGEELEEEPTA
jgi:Domain of unknown function (DUF4157)